MTKRRLGTMGILLSLAYGLPVMASVPPTQAELDYLKETAIARRFPNAEVGMLRYNEETWVAPNGHYRQVIRETNKLLNERAKKYFSEAQRSYDTQKATLSVDFARTIAPDGKVYAVEPNAVSDTNPFADFPRYDKAKVKTFSFPASAPGVLTDCQWSLESHKALLGKHFSDAFLLHRVQPAEEVSYVLHLPKSLKLKSHLSNPDQLLVETQVVDEGDSNRYEWRMRHNAYASYEEGMPDWGELLPRLLLTTASSWQECAQWFLTLNEGHDAATQDVKGLAERLSKGLKDPTDKARVLYHWVLNNVRYVSVGMSVAGYETQTAQEVLKNRYGDCKDGSTLLVALLKSVGIPATYVFVATDSQPKVEESIPTLYQFDHCIAAAYLNGRWVYLDSVAKTTRFGHLPSMDQGTKALLVSQNPEWVELPYELTDSIVETRELAINPDGSLDAAVSQVGTGHFESALRGAYQAMDPDQIKTDFQESVLEEAPGGELAKFSLEDPQDLEKSFSTRYSYHASDYATLAGDIMVVRVPGLSYGMSVFDRPTRTRPVRPQGGQVVDRIRIKLPKGYRVRYLPASVALQSPYLRYHGVYRQNGNTITLESVTDYRGTTLLPKDYPRVRDLYRKRARFSKEMIVFEKLR